MELTCQTQKTKTEIKQRRAATSALTFMTFSQKRLWGIALGNALMGQAPHLVGIRFRPCKLLQEAESKEPKAPSASRCHRFHHA